MLSPAANAVFEKALPKPISQLPPDLLSTKTPTFGAITPLRDAGWMTGIKDEAIPAIDAELRKIPVTAADRVSRCARYDNDVPHFNLPAGKPRLLLFEKITGFRDGPSVDAARDAFLAMAERNGWAIALTESAGAFNPKTLSQFDAVIWNNISGDVLTLSQRDAFRTWMENGGGFVGVHGSGGETFYLWDWYPDTLIGARFLAHIMDPHYQDARVVVDDVNHPIAKGLPRDWMMSDEWYSFKANPRASGAKIIATLDESTYTPAGFYGESIRMGDHPIAWTNCIGKGRSFYSAIGHRPETYSQPEYVTMLQSAIAWAATSGKGTCPAK
ncbi:ThuA domain-containing protein [Sphingobium boeckii]|uniref:ThuA-like domain-containing protein n=1 Tax=Sphingobium boeckii TaxID=1082345 RepID=A0A7W9AHF9_9SPHN|nr:ThuA domain-containing protein [Sphingobium boeckii]MBB5685680.1 hypothetical protein [Sphingobium boeckii]